MPRGKRVQPPYRWTNLALGACVVLAFSSCRKGAEEVAQGSASIDEVRVQQESKCVGKGADTAAIVSAAIAAAHEAMGEGSYFLELRVARFSSDTRGSDVWLRPGRRDVLGGGAKVRVPKDGCAVVRELEE